MYILNSKTRYVETYSVPRVLYNMAWTGGWWLVAGRPWSSESDWQLSGRRLAPSHLTHSSSDMTDIAPNIVTRDQSSRNIITALSQLIRIILGRWALGMTPTLHLIFLSLLCFPVNPARADTRLPLPRVYFQFQQNLDNFAKWFGGEAMKKWSQAKSNRR